MDAQACFVLNMTLFMNPLTIPVALTIYFTYSEGYDLASCCVLIVSACMIQMLLGVY